VQVGVTFPQTEIGTDPEVIRDYAQAAEDLSYDHVLGADPSNREGWRGYTHKTMFHEPLTLFSFLAAITQRLEFVSGVLVLPQRQTALVANKRPKSTSLVTEGFALGWA
jgi:alkanesulfonate monooxygenase SsuD/methylene tetrahydromethanopterin reductase-like flavin-dependent oxidoreductase (luciferase family)